MTAPFPLLDLATAAGCPPAQDRHRIDCLVRWLIANGWDGARRLGITEPLTIDAGIGRLTIGPDVVDFVPAVRAAPPTPLPAPDPLRTARLAVCAACDRWSGDRCTVGGCGCSGQGHAGRLFSKCPLGKWPLDHTEPRQTFGTATTSTEARPGQLTG